MGWHTHVNHREVDGSKLGSADCMYDKLLLECTASDLNCHLHMPLPPLPHNTLLPLNPAPYPTQAPVF